MRLSSFFLYGLLLFVTGCSLLPTIAPENKELILLPPLQGPEAQVLKQVVTLQGNGDESSFILVSKFEAEQLALVALLATGQRLLSMDYDGQQLATKQFVEISLPSKEMLAMMQFALWPESAVKQHYGRDAGWLVSLDSTQRTLSTQTEKILTVHFMQQRVLIEHHLHQYEVLVETIEKTML